MLLLTPVTEHFSVDVLRRSRKVPPRIPVDFAEDGVVLNHLMTRVEQKFQGGFQ